MEPYSMSQIPVEIGLRILSYLEYSLEEEEAAWLQGLSPPPFYLKPVCLVSRRLRDLAQPLLFRNIPADREVRYKLFGTLSRRPDLGRAVRSMRVGGQRGEKERMVVPVAFTRAQNWLVTPVDYTERLRAKIWRGSDDASLAFLLLMTPNLVRLELECTEPPQFVSRVFTGTPRSSLHGFPLLRELILAPGSDTILNDPSWIRDWADAAFHPEIRTFHGKEVVWSSFEATKMKGSARNLEELYLDRTLIDSTGFEDLLSRYERLRKLVIVWGSPGWIILENGLSFDQLGEALRSKGRHLEYLDLDPSRWTLPQQYSTPGMIDSVRIGSLRELTNLKTLCIAPDVLLGAPSTSGDETVLPTIPSLLPPSLESLRLFLVTSKYLPMHRVREEIDNLIRSDSLPRLRYIRADLWPCVPTAAKDFPRPWYTLDMSGWSAGFSESDDGLVYIEVTRDTPTSTSPEASPSLA